MSKWKVQLALTKEELGVLLLALNSIDTRDEEDFMKQGISASKLYRKLYECWEELDEEYLNKNSQPGLTTDE